MVASDCIGYSFVLVHSCTVNHGVRDKFNALQADTSYTISQLHSENGDGGGQSETLEFRGAISYCTYSVYGTCKSPGGKRFSEGVGQRFMPLSLKSSLVFTCITFSRTCVSSPLLVSL